jgi:hypothetical protein
VYQQFLKDKGTIRSVRLLGNANLGKEVAEYDIFENWAIQRATYGANANRSFFELQLNEALLESDPALIQVVEPQQTSQADQTVLLENLWRESYKLTSTDILPTTTTSVQDAALPTAGYVNLDDVDITVFSLNDPSSIDTNIDNIGIGTKIWVAKVNSYDWGIYRSDLVPSRMTQLTQNLNKTSIATFSGATKLKVGDLIIIKFFNNSVNGVYRVLSVPSLTTVVIAYDFGNSSQTSINGNGVVFYLQTMRVKQASDIINLPYASSLLSGAEVLGWFDYKRVIG